MNKKILVIGALFFFTFSYSQNNIEKWDLRKCVEYATTNNISVKQADVNARLQKLTTNQAKMSLYPNANASISSNYSHGLSDNPTTGTLESASFFSGSVGFQTSYTLFNWFARKNNILASELDLKAQEANLDKAKNDIALVVANAFLQVMLRKEQVRTSKVQLDQTISQSINTRKLVDAGNLPELNAIQLEAQVARDSSALLQAEALVSQSYINLKATLNLDMSQPFEIEIPEVDKIPVDLLTDLSPEYVYNLAVQNQPQQKVTQLQLEASKKRVLAARGLMYPSVSAFGGLNSRFSSTASSFSIIPLPDAATGNYVTVSGTRYEVFAPRFSYSSSKQSLGKQLNNNFGQNLGISISIPIFNGLNARTNWERSKLNVRQVELQNEQELQTLKTNIYNAYQDAFAAFQNYNASLRNVEASEKAMDFSQKRFDIGLLGTLDYITTQNNLYRARIEVIRNHYDYIFKLKVLEFYKGAGIKL